MGIGARINDGMKQVAYNWLFGNMERGNAMENNYIELCNQEYNVWYNGNEQELARFYTNASFNEDSIRVKENYFYKNTYQSERVVHSGFPRLISDTMAKLIFAGGVTITEEDNQERLDVILKENNMGKQHTEGVGIESAFGKFAYKLSYDSELSDNVIIETIKSTNFEVFLNRGREQAINFFKYITHNKKTYKFNETYGKGYIEYSLMLKKGEKYEEVPLTTLQETMDYERVEFSPKVILAKVKTNKTIEGRSDYDGLFSEFDALDEVLSNYTEETRMAKTDIYYPDAFIENNALDTRPQKRYIRTMTRISDDATVQYEQPNLRADDWGKAYNDLINNILLVVGLSPTTVGIDSAGANSSAESRRLMERTSLRTRSERVELWTEFLQDFYELVLTAQDIFMGVVTKDYEVVVSFGEYITDTLLEKALIVKELVMAGITDDELAFDIVFQDSITDEVKQRVLENLGSNLIDDIEEDIE